MPHFVYIVRCADGTLYTGYARDPRARVDVHNSGRGAKYTSGRRPVRLVYSQACRSQGAALRREHQLKQMSRAEKRALISRRGRERSRRRRIPAMTAAPFDAAIARYPHSVQTMARAARVLIRATLPDVEETIDTSAPVVGYGYGPGYAGVVCTILLSHAGVKIGLVRGAELLDPAHMLEGTGRVHRHVALKSTSDLKRPAVTALIKATYTAWRARRVTRT